MSDLISRKAAIKAIRKDLHADKDFMSAIICEGIEDVLNGLPAAEPERKTGRWLDDHGNEKKDGYGADCSVCGWWSEYLTDFCGSCGADMRGTT